MHRWHLVLVSTLALGGCGQSSLPPGEKPPTPTLAEWSNDLKSSDEKTRWTAAYVLGDMGRQARPALPALAAALNDPSWVVRCQVVESLVYIDPQGEQVVGPLVEALHDPEPRVRAEVAKALARLGPAAGPAVRELTNRLKDDVCEVRVHAANALGSIGSAADVARPHLRIVASNDDEPAVREAAAEALRRIEGP
jgi:HEAT repeats/HEAT repeat